MSLSHVILRTSFFLEGAITVITFHITLVIFMLIFYVPSECALANRFEAIWT